MANGAAKPAMNIVTRRYKHGSIIYFENDRSDVIYILKEGKIVLTSIKIDSGEEQKEYIKLGEFFGVKSAIGKYPREETAQTIGDTTVLVVSRADFEKMIVKNVALVTKMLRVFSNQLRRIHKMVREALGQGESINPAAELFKIGEYYFKNGSHQQALHSYKKYLEHYPGTKFSDMAMKRIRSIETGGDSEDIAEDIMDTPSVAEPADSGMDMTDFTIDDDSGSSNDFDLDSSPAAPAAKAKSVSSEIDDFFSENDSDGADDFSIDDNNNKTADISEMFYEAVSQFSQEKFSESLELYKKILEIKTLKDDSERKIFEKAHFEIGRAYLKTGKFNDAITSMSNLIKKFPKSDFTKNAYLHIGMAFEMAKKIDKAIPYYNKVLGMEPKDAINKLALKRLKTLEK